ncbi:c-type cytochrome [Falsiroseomonas sp.]|uniref:cytochrome c oxidase subunit II n=1 Tax=Falsiroseomonas sp. TaxID=2870721 RepID=UPI003564D507
MTISPSPRAGGRAGALLALAAAMLAAGSSAALALEAAGPDAREKLELLRTALWIALPVALLATAALAHALLFPQHRLGPRAARWMVVGGGLALPGIALTAMLLVLPRGPLPAAAEAGPTIEIVARQFWWEIRYAGPAPGAPAVVTANELHIPAGVPVRLRLTSRDVIHGFAIPALGGAADLVPGRTEELVLRADAPGAFRAACYAFCGVQHAHMALPVLAMPRDEWQTWLRAQAAAAAAPQAGPALQGRDIFIASGCGSCHAVRGHGADGEAGPDLTHFASRETIGAGMLPNTRAALTGWIAATQQIKPGAKMPSFHLLTGPELHALATYLEGLR